MATASEVQKLAFTYSETAHAAGLSPSMVRKLVRLGKLEAIRIGRSVRIPHRAVLRLCGENPETAGAGPAQ